MPYADPQDPRRLANNRKNARKYYHRDKGQILLQRYERKLALQDEVDAYKVANGCVDCGFREHPRALQFDHFDPTTKVDTISAMIYPRRFAASKVWAEIEKCDIRCANCHAIKTETKNEYSNV